MKKGRRAAAALLLFAALLWAAAAQAAQQNRTPWATSYPQLWDRQESAETLGVPAHTRYAVYAAPFEDAWRGADGKAAMSVSEPFYVLGGVGDWRMVYYRLSGGAGRVGWAYMPEAAKESREDDLYGGKLLRVTREVSLTDDPWGRAGSVTRLHAGDTVIGLAMIVQDSGTLYYVETEAEGKTAWLFMDESAAEEVPMYHVEDGTLYVHEGVAWLGEGAAQWTWETDGTDDADVIFPVLSPKKGALKLSRIDLYGETYGYEWEEETNAEPGETEEIRRVVLPSTLRVLGIEVILFGSLEELVLPEGLSFISDSAFYAVDFGRITIPKGLTVWNNNAFDRCTVESYQAEMGNALFSSRDGVLFSADLGVLLSYPDGRKDLHYDVPAGVREIADRAFYSDMMSIPLKTVSLPMGLTRIGRYAFSGCGMLISLTVPLTVTELSEDAFSYCVSLERLSLPPGLSARLNLDWSAPGDFTYYNGDNGTTWTNQSEDDDR